MIMWLKCSPRALKTSHSLLPEGWFTWGGPGFKMITPAKVTVAIQKGAFISAIKFSSAKNAKTLWRWNVCNKLYTSIVKWLK